MGAPSTAKTPRRTGNASSGPTTTGAEGGKLRGELPQVRVVALAECGARALVAASIGAYAASEKALTSKLLGYLGQQMLVIADRNFPGYELFWDAAATGADPLWRVSSSFHLAPGEVLDGGSRLSSLKAPRASRRAGSTEITVRVTDYELVDENGAVTDAFRLITTLLDPTSAPARELAELHRSRWQIETAFGAFRSDLKGDSVVLRSRTPDGAEQERWALLCAYHAIRELICSAASLAEQDPLRISFINALDAVRAPIGDPGAFPPHHPIDGVLSTFLAGIAMVKNPDRRGRSNPRQAKRSLRYLPRAADPTKRRKPRASLTLVMLFHRRIQAPQLKVLVSPLLMLYPNIPGPRSFSDHDAYREKGATR